MHLVVRFLAIGVLAAVGACAHASTPSGTQTPVAAAEAPKSAEAKPKMVCKRVPVVGSNVGTERVCTVVKPSEEQRSQPQDAQGRNGSSNGN